MPFSITRKLCWSLLGSSCAAALLLGPVYAQAPTRNFDIPAEGADSTVPLFAKQSGLQVLAAGKDLGQVKTNSVNGSLPVDVALTRLLANTGLAVKSNDGQSVLIADATPVASKRFVQVAAAEPVGSDKTMETVVVTGVLHSFLESKAPVSTNTIDASAIGKKVPLSAADILADIPGVTVTSDVGESKNTIVVRGLSFGTSAQTAGYYWVKMEEDGMPILGENLSNFVPDEFLRFDSTIARVQSLNGGSGAITGPNAPSGVFNYISRNGFTDPGTRAVVRLGYEGGGNPPYTKGELYHGEDHGDWAWSIGGHYRRGYGYREVDFPANRGGQIKANLNYKYTTPFGEGEIQLRLKWLDDKQTNLDYFRPLGYGWGPFSFTDEFGRSANFIPKGDTSQTLCDPNNGKCSDWNPKQGIHAKAWVVGADVDHDFGGGWKFSQKLQLARDQALMTYSTQGVGSLTAPSGIASNYPANSVLDALGRSFSGLNKVPGVFTLYDRTTGVVAATLNQDASGNVVMGAINNLPNRSINGNSDYVGSNLLLTVGTMNRFDRQDQLMDLTKLIREWGDWTFVAGVWYMNSQTTVHELAGGNGLMPLQNGPSLYGMQFTTSSSTAAGGPAGTVYQFTNNAGWGALYNGGQDLVWKFQETSPLVGITWEPTGNWMEGFLFDFGIRYSNVHVAGHSDNRYRNIYAANRSFGGEDGLPQTIYDNVYMSNSGNVAAPPVLPTSPLVEKSTYNTFAKSYDFLQYSGAIAYQFDMNNSIHARYTYGKKNTEGMANGYTSQYSIQTARPDILSVITQYELEYRMRYQGLSFTPVVYMTDLNKVNFINCGTFKRADNTTYFCSPVGYNHFKVWGASLDASVDIFDWLNIHNIADFTDARSLQVGTWYSRCVSPTTAAQCAAQYGDPPINALYVTYSKGPMERSAKFQNNMTVNLNFDPVSFYYRFRYIGRRPTTYTAQAYLPINRTSDAGVTWDINDNYQATFNVNNLFDNTNATQIGQTATTLPSGMTTQQYIAQYPNALVAIQTNAPRSFWFTVSAKW